MPFSSDRKSVFEPPRSFWSRLLAFGRRDETTSYYNPVAKDIVFPPDPQLLSSPKVLSKPDLFTLLSYTSTATALPAFRPYPIKRQSNDHNEDRKLGAPLKFQPWLKQRQSSAATGAIVTIINSLDDGQDSTTTHGTLTASLDKVLESSDVEDGVVNAQRSDTIAHSPGWKHAFLRKQHEEESKRRKPLKQLGSVTTEIAPAVPATSLLIRAYNWITLAAQEAQRRLFTSHFTTDQGIQSATSTLAPNGRVDLGERFGA
ncbi:hypothetical protein FRB94_005218 [Tulasnella sp. JGI-2019a]|nr:hypothetical protein FRB93_013776 [Tulasnella sp. JGI-2019a]KAG9000711.1 hypothetical protein FRB94_005218 [Tulasnella sp. JGI-2019a]